MNRPADFLTRIAQHRDAGNLPAAMALCQQQLDAEPDDIVALHAMGQLQHMSGDLEQARKTLSRAWAIDPATTPVAMALAETLNAQGRQSDAVDVLRSLSRLRPTDVALQRRLGGVMFRAGQWEVAASCFDLWCAAAPDDADALISLGSSLQMQGDLSRACALYEQALVVDPTRADAWSNLGTLQQGRKDLAAARQAYDRALALDASNAEAVAGLASVSEFEGDSQAASALLLEHANIAPQNTELSLLLAKLKRRSGEAVAAENVLRDRLSVSSLARAEASRLRFCLGDALDTQDRCAEAFVQYQQANELKRVSFDPAGHRAFVDHIVKAPSGVQSGGPQAAEIAPAPLFIVGMPRSGTTLIEQMLGCHARVHAAGERSALPRSVRQLLTRDATFPYPTHINAASIDQLNTVAEAYRGSLWEDAGDVNFVTDKLPGNFVYLGVLPMLFPNARVIHCRRDPLDVALSLYARDFAFASLPFAYSLDHIGDYYADYRRLMAHWKATAPLPILDLEYARLVADPEHEIRRVCDFLELPFESQMLAFHQSDRVAFTASNAQVRQPVYTSSVGRAGRYAEELAPLRARLKSAGLMDELG
ncbi:MAG: sulfotransferase [Gammaproteobacteria bacterium]